MTSQGVPKLKFVSRAALEIIKLVFATRKGVQPRFALHAIAGVLFGNNFERRGHLIDVWHAAIHRPERAVEQPKLMVVATADHAITLHWRRILSASAQPSNFRVTRVPRTIAADDNHLGG